jgi:hypothetical protein
LNPNFAGNSVTWPQYQTASDTNLILDLTLSTETGYRAKFCDFWDEAPPPS